MPTVTEADLDAAASELVPKLNRIADLSQEDDPALDAWVTMRASGRALDRLLSAATQPPTP